MENNEEKSVEQMRREHIEKLKKMGEVYETMTEEEYQQLKHQWEYTHPDSDLFIEALKYAIDKAKDE